MGLEGIELDALPGAREFRSRIVKISTPPEFRAVVEEYFPRD